ncbi:MAG: uridine kinase [Oscillospiraceae bacterium]|nr:uridine kinase [Oscillospiraceae bacterium]
MQKLFRKIESLQDSSRTVLIGIDGLGGAGKSTISRLLEDYSRSKNYPIFVLHVDDFIHPRAVRYNPDVPEWKCYYHLQWRYDYLIQNIMKPLRNGQDFHRQIAFYNKENDSYFSRQVTIPVGSLVILEGIFLQREELRGMFDYMLYLDISEETRLQRVLKRDGYIGSQQQIRHKYEVRYFPAERIYTQDYNPAAKADYVIRENEVLADFLA